MLNKEVCLKCFVNHYLRHKEQLIRLLGKHVVNSKIEMTKTAFENWDSGSVLFCLYGKGQLINSFEEPFDECPYKLEHIVNNEIE